jgi:hypothetical protein
MADEKERTKDMQEQQKPTQTPEKELEEAVDRVFQHYGPDLSDFVRDVQKDIQKRAASNEGCSRQRLFV